MYEFGENILYYLTVYNENYAMAPMPEGAKEGILKGMYKIQPSQVNAAAPLAHLLGSGPILNETLKAQRILEENYGIPSEVWSVTSYKELHRDGIDVERWNMLHPSEKPRVSYLGQTLGGTQGVVVAASDYVKALPDMISRWIRAPFFSLGTNGFGRSDTRKYLRDFFEVDARYIVIATLSTLMRQCKVKSDVVKQAIKDLDVNPEKANPMIS